MRPIKRRIPRPVTARQFRAALTSGMCRADSIKWQNYLDMNLIKWGARTEWDWHHEVNLERYSPLVSIIRGITKMTSDQMDAIFDVARYIEFQDPVA